MGSTEQHYSLRWNDYTVKIVTAFQSLRDEEDFVDVTVACDGHHYSAHKMVLSACSPYFRSILRMNPCQHPIVILKDVGHVELERLLEFMYNGEVNIAQDQLAAFLKTAENLKIRGLAGSSEDMDQLQNKDAFHEFTNTNSGANNTGLTSGKSSPSVGFNNNIASIKDSPGYGPNIVSKDEEGNGTGNTLDSGISYSRIESPQSKRRKRNNAPATSHTDSNTSSHTPDGMVSESGVDLDGTGVTGNSLSMEEDLRMIERREMKPEPSDSLVTELGSDVSHQGDQLDQRPVMYPLGMAGPSSTPGVGSQENLSSQEPGDVSALMAITNSVQGTAVTEQPIKCPLCSAIIKQARNLRRHVIKRHLPAAQRGEITEADVKRVLEQKLKNITVTPLTEEERIKVLQRTRRKGIKTPRKKKGIAALPANVNPASINEHEITIRRLPQKKEKRVDRNAEGGGYVLQLVPEASLTNNEMIPMQREEIIHNPVPSREKDPQDGVVNLATTPHHELQPMAVVVSEPGESSLESKNQPMSLTVTQTASGVQARIPADAALQAGMRLHTESPNSLNRDMSTLTYEPQVNLNENVVTYQSSTSHVMTQPPSTTTASSEYLPVAYWTAAPNSSILSMPFQPPIQTVFTSTHPEYFPTGSNVARPPAFDKLPQYRRKPY